MTPDERAARIHHHEYSGEGIREHAERIVALEELVLNMYELLDETCDTYYENDYHALVDRMRELGVTE